MNAIINRILNNSLEDLKGTIVEGQVPLTEDLLNEMIQEFLQNKAGNDDISTTNSASNANGNILNRMIAGLDVKYLRIELHEKVAVLKVNLRKLP